MILAAGLGTRLRPLTETLPKALVPIDQQPALAWILNRLNRVGATSFMINTHYYAEQIEQFVQTSPFYDRISLSHEPEILGTGGGLLQTQKFWEDTPFILHNVDVFSDTNLQKAWWDHQKSGALATLLTQNRPTQTKLLIDETHRICGIHYYKNNDYRLLHNPQGELMEHGFSGIHIISPKIFPLIQERGSFSIIDVYLRLIQEGHLIQSFDMQNAYWKDIGTQERYQELLHDFQTHPGLKQLHL